MKITFFEIEAWEKKYLRKRIKEHQVAFYTDTEGLDKIEEFNNTEILSPFIYSNIDQPIPEALPQLKMIATGSTGFNHIDM